MLNRNAERYARLSKLKKARKEAKKAGHKKYFSGTPCIKGHVSERYVNGNRCCACARIVARSQERKEYDKSYNIKNKDKRSSYQRGYHNKNKEKRTAKAEAWSKNNPEKVRIYKKNYKARLRAQKSGGISSSELAKWTKSQKKVCYWCDFKCGNEYHIDHYVPLSKGGEHTAHNLVISCPPCNLKKNAKDPYEWAKECGKLL